MHILHDKAVLCDGHHHAADIDLLEAVLAEGRDVHVCRDRNERYGVHVSRGDSGDEICRTGAGRCHTDTDLSRSSCIAVRSMCRALLMGGQNMVDLILMPVELIVHVKDRAAGITEYGINALLF